MRAARSRASRLRATRSDVVTEQLQGAGWFGHAAIAPNRVPQTVPRKVPQSVPSQKLFRERRPRSGALGTLLGSRLGTLWNLAGAFGRASSKRLGQGVGVGVGIAPAGVTPLAVVVEVVDGIPADVARIGLGAGAVNVVEKRTLLEENWPG